MLHRSDVTIDLAMREVEYVKSQQLPPWRITLVDTGSETQTGGRLRRIAHLLPDGEPFCMTYGDGVSDVDIRALVEFHKGHGLDATLTVVLPPGRFGATVLDDHRVVRFTEKPAGDGGYINGGFFVLQKRTLDRVDGDETLWEREPLEGLARDGQLAAFVHKGFWLLDGRQVIEPAQRGRNFLYAATGASTSIGPAMEWNQNQDVDLTAPNRELRSLRK